jgi:hypothetical protein
MFAVQRQISAQHTNAVQGEVGDFKNSFAEKGQLHNN